MIVQEELNKIANNLNGGAVTETATTKQTDNNGRKKPRLELQGAPEFKGTVKTSYTTTQDLCKDINKIFSEVISDYEGCMIEPDAYGNLSLKIYLAGDKPEDVNKVKCLEKIGSGTVNNVFDRLSNFNRSQSSRYFALTEDAKDILEEFVYAPNGKKPNWNSIAVEFTDNSGWGAGQRIYTKVQLDLKRVIKKMYGKKLADGGYADYMISMVRPLGYDFSAQQGMMYNPAALVSNYIISIAQLDSKELERLCKEIGIAPQSTTGFAIVRS